MSGMGPAPPPMPPPAYGMPPPMPMPAQQRSMLPMIGGALLLVAAILGIATWAYVIVAGTSFVNSFMPGGYGAQFVTGIILVCGAIEIILSLIALLGAVMAIMHRMWGVALAGSILGLFTIGFYGLASLLSLVALILIAISHKDFT